MSKDKPAVFPQENLMERALKLVTAAKAQVDTASQFYEEAIAIASAIKTSEDKKQGTG